MSRTKYSNSIPRVSLLAFELREALHVAFPFRTVVILRSATSAGTMRAYWVEGSNPSPHERLNTRPHQPTLIISSPEVNKLSSDAIQCKMQHYSCSEVPVWRRGSKLFYLMVFASFQSDSTRLRNAIIPFESQTSTAPPRSTAGGCGYIRATYLFTSAV